MTSLNSLKKYGSFAVSSRKKINIYLNIVLWFCIITGPAIALGILSGIFHEVDYGICILISVYMTMVSFIHLLIIKKWPTSGWSGLFALFAMDILLVLMANAHVGIYLTWFLIPLMSLLFVNWKIFALSTVVNYCFMVFSTWQISGFYASQRIDYDSATEYFISHICGYTIETFMMTAAAIVISKVVTEYFSNLIENYQKLDKDKEALIQNEQRIEKDRVMLESMAGIYDNVNLLDFAEMTEMPLHDDEHRMRSFDLEKQSQTYMNLQLNDTIEESQLADFKFFTNITTIQKRLSDKKFIAKDFLSKSRGWFRAQYINISSPEDDVPDRIIYTVQNIDKDKRKEEHLISVAITDELTGLFNRRCFDNDMEEYSEKGIDDDFVIISIDVNGLKTVNDTLGHSAGDELIKGASYCCQLAYGSYGRVYRTGGDEFMAVILADNCDFIQDILEMMTNEWTGKEVDSLAISVGYAAHKDYPAENIDGLVKIADAMMYEEKEKYYKKTGKKRRT